MGAARGQARAGSACRSGHAGSTNLGPSPAIPRPCRVGRPIWPSIDTRKHIQKGPPLGGWGLHDKTMKTWLLSDDAPSVTKKACIFVVASPEMNQMADVNLSYFQLKSSLANPETTPWMDLVGNHRWSLGQEKRDADKLLHYTKVPKEKRKQRWKHYYGNNPTTGLPCPITGDWSCRNQWRKGAWRRVRKKTFFSPGGDIESERIRSNPPSPLGPCFVIGELLLTVTPVYYPSIFR